jgi:hypothetical protein
MKKENLKEIPVVILHGGKNGIAVPVGSVKMPCLNIGGLESEPNLQYRSYVEDRDGNSTCATLLAFKSFDFDAYAALWFVQKDAGEETDPDYEYYYTDFDVVANSQKTGAERFVDELHPRTVPSKLNTEKDIMDWFWNNF